MDLIKKKIALIYVTGKTDNSNYGVFIPDTGVTYSVLFSLSQNNENVGYFDISEDDLKSITGVTTTIVTGTTSSKLPQLRTYATGGTISDLYRQYDGLNGVVVSESSASNNNSKYVYYINGVKYVDLIVSGASSTTFSVESKGLNDLNALNSPLVANDSLNETFSQPIVNGIVDVQRQMISVLENNYRISTQSSLFTVLNYAGGNYFNVYNNT